MDKYQEKYISCFENKDRIKEILPLFDEYIERRNTGSIKWNVSENTLPLWIADMDFKTADEITKALRERVNHGIYGYTEPDDDFYNAYINFYKDRYNVDIKKEEILFSLGVVPTISSTVRKLTEVGDNVVVLSPVYNIFYNSIVNNQRNVLEVELIKDNDDYKIDWENLEKAFSLDKTKLIIFCNPANPVSKIWSKEELIRLGELASKYNVVVLSDEIHAFLTRPGTSYIPFFSLNETNRRISVNAISVTKSFNLAGIHTSIIVIPNEDLRKKVNRQINTDEVAEPNIFSCVAAKAALSKSRDWLDALRVYLFANRDYVKDYLKEHIKNIHLIDGDATYLLWIDVSKVSADSKAFVKYLKENEGLYLSDGEVYGKGGKGFIRLNVACPRNTLAEALKRLEKGVKSFRS